MFAHGYFWKVATASLYEQLFKFTINLKKKKKTNIQSQSLGITLHPI